MNNNWRWYHWCGWAVFAVALGAASMAMHVQFVRAVK